MKTTISNKRKGISTILGALFFVGILFSAYVPMTLVMKQADTIYEQVIHETRIKDEYTYDEDLMVYAFSKTQDDKITVFVKNNGDEVVNIVGIWLNDDRESVDEVISSAETESFGPYQVTGSVGATLKVKVTTSNGNVFACNLGDIFWSDINGWYTPSLAISVTIINDSGQYEITVLASDGDPVAPYGYYKSSGTELDDIYKTFMVPPGENFFDVIINKRQGGSWPLLSLTEDIKVPTEFGNPVVYVVADGT